MVDSSTVFNVVSKNEQTTEKRLQIYVLALRKIYDDGELARIVCISGNKNPANCLTKTVLSE